MPLTLRILTYRDQPVPGAAAGTFAGAGGSLGRSPDNTLVLDDPGKYVSRVHATVSWRDGEYFLEDVGSNPSVVNDRPLGRGREIALAHGDRIAIGEYRLEAALEAVLHTALDTARPGVPPAPPNNPDLPLFVPPPPPAAVNLPPLHLMEAAKPGGFAAGLPDALAGVSLLDVGYGGFDGQAGGGDDPLGLNLFGAGPAQAKNARGADSDHASPELLPYQMGRPIDAAPRSAPLPPAAPVAPAGFSIPDDYDPLADLLAPMAASPSPGASLPPPPAPVPEPAAAARPISPSPSPSPPAAAAGDNDILQALLRGLGLPDLKLNRSGAEVAETVGAMLREATAGTIDVLMARALTKKESRIEMTMLSVRSNNPLKFFPNADSALTQMLNSAMPGYMPPVQAMAGAFDDLRAHELAVIAGMRAALGAVLHRFDPARIESRLAGPTVFDKMLGAGRKAKMWDRLVELYGEIAREADDDLQRLFGEKFSEAYEEQVARLRQGRN
ncbi:MAG: tagH [Massilia sp.]|nr:tagH [Massilia sp.]MDB5950256.1 tagH [Massilia sp.]